MENITEYMKMQNYEVECAGDGEAARALLKSRPFDIQGYEF